MINRQIEQFDIIDSSVYNENTSLRQDITNALRKNDKLSDTEIINIVVKYFISYIYPHKIDYKIDLEEINKIFSITNFFFKISRNPWTKIEMKDKKELELLNFIQENWYSLSMLWDIAATVELFKEIANKEISPIKFNYEYLWLDLWAWSGILLLAQYIQAEKNNFLSISNFWLEISNSCFRTKLLVNELMFWKAVNCDTTKEESYDFLKYSDSEITHISNETIPTVWISFWHYLMNKTPFNPDPFIENNKALFLRCSDKITEATIFFPEKVRIVLETNPMKIINSEKKMIWERSNKFMIDYINELERKIQSDQKDLWFKINPYLFPTWIEIGWEIIRQDEIWSSLIKSWIVKKLPDWRHRWNTNKIY